MHRERDTHRHTHRLAAVAPGPLFIWRDDLHLALRRHQRTCVCVCVCVRACVCVCVFVCVCVCIISNHAASGWRIHCGVEVTESSTNKQHTLSRLTRGTGGAGAAVAALVSDETPHRPQLRGALTEILEIQCPRNLQDRVDIQRTFENVCLGRAVLGRANGSSRSRFRCAACRSLSGRGHGRRRRHTGHRRAIVPGRVVRAAVTSALLVLHAHFEE
jgi:hypothetical protein